MSEKKGLNNNQKKARKVLRENSIFYREKPKGQKRGETMLENRVDRNEITPSVLNIKLTEKAEKIIFGNKHYYLIEGGRVGGKTHLSIVLSVILMLAHPYMDGIACRVSYGALADSLFSEYASEIGNAEQLNGEFEFKKSPLRIVRRNNAGTIYFIGYGGADTDRTKGMKTSHKVHFVILEETQQLRTKRNFDEAMASFRRNFGEDVIVFVLGNPPPQEAHWFNVFAHECERDDDWEVMHFDYRDILPFINDFDLKEILKTKKYNPEYYEWFYLGKTTGGFGSVYPMFRKDLHTITAQEFEIARTKGGLYPVACVIGGDGAVNNDSTAFVPMILLNNGQAVIGMTFHHEPKVDGVVGYHQLVKDDLVRWFNNLCVQFNLGTLEEKQRNPYAKILPIYMRIDSAAPDLIEECKYFLGGRCNVSKIKKATVQEMVGVMQSALSDRKWFILDYGGYYDYHLNKFVKKEMDFLTTQLSQLIWNEKQDNYDPIVPNDDCDALTYANLFWYGNNENMQYFDRLRILGQDSVKIENLLRQNEK